jgi:hypothetical protein
MSVLSQFSPSYQPLDSDLTAIAGLSTTGIIERTGTGTAAIITKPPGDIVGTTGAQTLADKTLTSPTINTPILNNPTINNGFREEVRLTIPSTLNPDNGSIQKFALTGDIDWTNDDEIESGESILIMVNDSVSDYTITWPTIVWVNATAPPIPIVGFACVELWKVNTKLYGAYIGEVAS